VSAYSEAAVEPARIGAPSKLDKVREAMDPDSRGHFDADLLAGHPPEIHARLVALGFEVDVSTVRNWCRKARAQRVRV